MISLPLLSSLSLAGATVLANSPPSPISISLRPPLSASAPIPTSFVSFAIEFAFFPDFAGNKSNPNRFSYNLLSNLRGIQGDFPIMRIGGNTQDYYLLSTTQLEALVGTYDLSRSRDYPTTITIGPSFFESYQTWPNVSFVHGFNLAKANNTVGINSLLTSVPYACRALQINKLTHWELGNEPDLFSTSAQGPVRPPTWNESDYVTEWLSLTRQIKRTLAKHPSCANLPTTFLAPSFGGTSNHLNPIITWRSGLSTDHDIPLISSHNYIGGATQPGITLQATLMNHSTTVASVSHQLNVSRLLSKYTLPHSSARIPFILGETNSLYNEGTPGLSNTFGAALWGLDFNLYCAANNISRVHMQQGTNFRYAAWQPLRTASTTVGTKPPYYGSIAVAESLGNLRRGTVQVAEIGPLGNVFESAYATYVDEKLVRIVVVQMREYNYTTDKPGARPSETFSFQLPKMWAGKDVGLRRLMANGSDAISGITFDGYSFNHELGHGKPVLLGNVTREERVRVGSGGMVRVEVPWSSAVIVHVDI